MSEYLQALIILCVFLGFIFTVYIVYKLNVRIEKSKDLKNLKDEINIDIKAEKKE